MHATSFRVWQNLYTKTQKKHSAQILNLLDNVHLYREKLALLGQHTSFAKIFFHLQSRSIHWQIHRMSKVLSFSNSSSPATRMWRTQKFSQCLSSRGRSCLFRQALLKSVWVCVYMSVLFCSQVLQLKVACGLWNLTSVYVSVFQFVWKDMCAHCSAIIVGVGAGIVVIVTQEYFKRNNERSYN